MTLATARSTFGERKMDAPRRVLHPPARSRAYAREGEGVPRGVGAGAGGRNHGQLASDERRTDAALSGLYPGKSAGGLKASTAAVVVGHAVSRGVAEHPDLPGERVPARIRRRRREEAEVLAVDDIARVAGALAPAEVTCGQRGVPPQITGAGIVIVIGSSAAAGNRLVATSSVAVSLSASVPRSKGLSCV